MNTNFPLTNESKNSTLPKIALISNYGRSIPERAQQFFGMIINYFDGKLSFLQYNYIDLLDRKKYEEILKSDGIILSTAYFYISDPLVQAEFAPEIALIQEAANKNIPIFGMCFGHQLIGVAFGLSPKYVEEQDHSNENQKNAFLNEFTMILSSKNIDNDKNSDEVEYIKGFDNTYLKLIEEQPTSIQFMQHKTKKIFGFGFFTEPDKVELAQKAAYIITLKFIEKEVIKMK